MYGEKQSVPCAQVKSICVALPKKACYNEDIAWLSQKKKKELIHYIGVRKRHVVDDKQDLLTLALAACESIKTSTKTFERLGICLLVTQTSPWVIPSAAFYLHKALKLEKYCLCLEINLGCSGYVYGLWLASVLLAQRPRGTQALLIAGDVSTQCLDKKDSSTVPLILRCP